MQRINWTKGLFRIWLVLTLIWAGLMFVDERPDQQLKQYLTIRPAVEQAEALANASSDPITLPSGRLTTRAEMATLLAELHTRQTARWGRIMGYAQAVAIPSLVLLALGMMVGWAIRGFKKG